MWNTRTLPFRTSGISEPTTTSRRIEETEEIPSLMFSSFPLNITPSVPIRGMSRATRSDGELTVFISMVDGPFSNL